MKIATFDIDAQNGFTPICPNELPVPEGNKIVDELNYLATRGELRIGSKDAHSKRAVWIVNNSTEMLQPLPYKNADLTWVKHCELGTKGFELLRGLPDPTEYDYFVWKGMEPTLHPYGACYHDIEENLSTGVIEYLKQNEVDVVLVGGLAFDFCVKKTVIQLSKADFSVIVYLKATRALSKEGHKETLQMMKKEQNIKIASSREELDEYLTK